MFIRNNYLNKIKPWISKPLIKILTGMRRTGKSTLLRQIADELRLCSSHKVIELNLELLEWEHLRDYHALHDYIITQSAGQNAAVCIDEIQECGQWEQAINSLLAMSRFDLYLTGSNAKLLSSELATKIAGRYIEFQVYSLGFAEHLEFRGAIAPQQEEFSRYLRYGGLPGIHHLNIEEAPDYLASLYDTIILRDVVQRHQVRDVALLDRIIRFAFDNIGNVTTANGIAKYLKSQRQDTSINTVQTYLGYLENCFAVYRLPRYDIKGKQLLSLYEKYYVGDIGLRHGILGFKERDIGGLLENTVCLELFRRGYTVSVGKIGNKEIDFIAEKKDGKKIYLQVCYLLASGETIDREFGALEQIADNHPKYVLSMDQLPFQGRNGIEWRRVDSFLLDTSW